MLTVHPGTLLFNQLSLDEANALAKLCVFTIVEGRLPSKAFLFENPWLEQATQHKGLFPENSLVPVQGIFVQYAVMSITLLFSWLAEDPQRRPADGSAPIVGYAEESVLDALIATQNA